MIRAVLLIVIALACGPARAGLTQQDLDRVRVDLPKDAALPLGLEIPAVLLFVDFDCPHICDAVLAQTANMLTETGLKAGADFRLVVVGLDPDDSAASARAFVARQLDPADRPAATILQPDAVELAAMTTTLGYGFVRDDDNGSFAHPAARYVIAADGRVRSVQPAFGDGADMRAAIVGANLGTGAIATQLILFCYGLNPETGRYSLSIRRTLTGLGLLTALTIMAGLATALVRERRQS